MKFEIVEAYVIRNYANEIPRGWSMHIYFPEIELDLRGIRLIKTRSNWMFEMPHLRNYDPEEKKVIGFPVITFSDSEKTKLLKEEIKKKSIEYVTEKLKEQK